MSQRAQRSLDAARKAMPEGTFAVGAGLMVAGLTTYGFFVAAARTLSERDYAAVIGGLWPLVFVVAPGCFLPLEQEVGRALAHRRAQGIGGGPIVRRAAIAAIWPPALSPPTARAPGRAPSSSARSAAHLTAAHASSLAAGKGCSGAQR
jgi:hypothetical protein